jgi:hypothetical protein
MMYIAPSVLLAATGTSLNCPVFLWDNLVTASGITADYADASYPATNLANPQTTSVWKSGNTAAQNIVFTVDPSNPVNAVGIARHNFGSGAVGVKIYGIAADVGAVFVLLADLVPGDNSPILALVASAYYVQIKITLTPIAVAPQAAVIYIGSALIMPRSTPAGFVAIKDALERDMLSGIAENGDFLGDLIVSQRLSTSIDFKLLDGAWYRANMRPFVHSSIPFFYAQAPALLPNETGFCKFNGVPKGQVNQLTGEVDVSLSVTGLAL